MTEITIREYGESDYSGTLAAAASLPDWFDKDAIERAIPVDLKHQKVFFAESGGNICGFISLFIAEGRLNIGWLGVVPEMHRKGIGKMLLSIAEEFGIGNNLEEIATYTLGNNVDYAPYESTREFYRRNGFRIYQRSQTDNESCPEEIKIKKGIKVIKK